MASIPLPALHVQAPEQPDLLQKFGQIGALKNQQLQSQLGQTQLQNEQFKLSEDQKQKADEDKLTQLYVDNNGDIGKTFMAGAKSGVGLSALNQFQTKAMQAKQAAIQLVQTQGAEALRQADLVKGAHDYLGKLKPEDRAAAYPQVLNGLGQSGLDISQMPQQYPGDEEFNKIGAVINTHTKLVEDAAKEAGINKDNAQATAATAAAANSQAELPGKIAGAQQAQKVNAGTSPTGITAAQQGQLNFQRQKLQIEQQRADKTDSKKNLDEQAIETAAQSLASGDLTRLKDIASMRGDQRLLIFNRAKQLNPNFSTSDVDRKIAMENSFTNGKDGQNLQSFGTFLEHAGAASDIVNQYRASNTKLINTPVNKLKDAFGSAAYTQYTAALEPVRKEFEGFLLGGKALYGDDRKAAETILSDNATPAQQQAALKQMGHTVQARYNESNFRYKRTMGKDLQDAISPEAMTGAQKIGINLGGGSQGQPSGPPAGATHKAKGSDGQWHYTNAQGQDLGVAQ